MRALQAELRALDPTTTTHHYHHHHHHAATLLDGACNRMWSWLQPYVPPCVTRRSCALSTR